LTTTLYTVTGLSNGTSYVFRVSAANTFGTGVWSALSSAVTPAPAPWIPQLSRIAGGDRYATAVETSQSFMPFAAGQGTVYLTSGEAFPDALGAGALAAEVGAPVLLTRPDSLPDVVKAELLRLHPARIKVVGGTSAVSAEVLAEVTALAFAHDTVRIGGENRYETNRLLVSNALAHASTVYLAVGSNFPDALAAGPAAATVGGAVILVNGSASTLDTPTLDLLTSLGVTNVRLVGGTSAISTGIENQLNALHPGGVVRLAGADRYDTAAKIVAGAWPGTAPTAVLASGANFPDALAAGALGFPMLTTRPSCVPPVTLTELNVLKPSTILLVGGTAALSDNVAQLGSC
jgi:putative cell wall-binding protein